MRKQVLLLPNAEKELNKFPRSVQLKCKALFEVLATEGKLEAPFAKKLAGQQDLFEIRVKHQGQWRVMYAYIENKIALILSAFVKKTQKTPLDQLTKANNRLNTYLLQTSERS